MSCERSWEVRAIDEGRLAASDIAAFERHTEACSSCAAEWSTFEHLRRVSEDLATRGPSDLSDLELRRLRARVLRDAMSASSPSRPRAIAAAVGVVALAGAAFVAVRANRAVPATEEPFAANVTASVAAHWTQSRDRGEEHVVLDDGDVELQVRKQRPDERFLVTVPDGEVEVRGTTFQVSVHEGRTSRVHVDTGVVVVRVHGETVLTAGETWAPPGDQPMFLPPPLASASAAEPVFPALRAPASSARSAGVRKPTVPAATAPSGDREMTQYDEAIQAYRLARFELAATLLHTFVADHSSSALVDDASFIEASSLASAGHTEAAARLASDHLRRFPSSFHHKDAAILVARIGRDHDDCEAARAVLAPWTTASSVDATVTAALGRCPPAVAPTTVAPTRGAPTRGAPTRGAPTGGAPPKGAPGRAE